jgi:hypothetical protein
LRVALSSGFHRAEGIEEKSSESGEARHRCAFLTGEFPQCGPVPDPEAGAVLRKRSL